MKTRGFSSPELLVSVVSFAIVAMILSTLWLMAQNGLNEISASARLSENLSDLRVTLSTPVSCTRNFAGLALSMAAPAGIAIPRIISTDKDGNQMGVIFEAGVKRSGVTFQGMTLRPNVQVTLSHISADLEILYRKDTASGAISLTRHLPILAQVKQGLIQKCWLRKDGATVAGSTTCMALSGGAHNEFDPVNQVCTVTNGEWFNGNSASASCPAGTDLPKQAVAWANCSADEPAGFTDPTPTSDGNPYFYILNKNTKTCSCVYDVMIPPAVRAQFRCQILCVVL